MIENGHCMQTIREKYARFLLLICIFFSFKVLSSEETEEKLSQRLKEAIHFDPHGSNPIGFLSIGKDRPIDQSTFLYVKFALDHFKALKTPLIILQLDTPGGEVFSALKIVDLLHQIDREEGIPVIAFIDNWAISAGAMLAYACRFIASTFSASMGAAEPVMVSQEGQMQSASEKVNSAIRSEFSNLASYYGRNPLIAEAMVDKDIFLVLREGKIVELTDEKQLISDGKHPDRILVRKGKLLTLNAKQLVEFGVSDWMAEPLSLAAVTTEERKEGRWPASKSLVFQQPFLASIPDAALVSFNDWRIDFFAFLTHPLVSSILFMGLVLSIYMEFSNPGFGLPFILGVGCLSLIVLSHFAIHAVAWLEVIFLICGIILLLVELLILPGFGFTGILGILLTLAGLCSMMLPSLRGARFSWNLETINLSAFAFLRGLAYLSAAFLFSVVLSALMTRFMPGRKSLFKRLVLDSEHGEVKGEFVPPIKTKGEAFTPLRPAGKVLISGKIYDAIGESAFIEVNAPIFIARYEGNKMIVKQEKREGNSL
ncbi:MAG: NfeD family protein [Anaerolineae bacterium]